MPFVLRSLLKEELEEEALYFTAYAVRGLRNRHCWTRSVPVAPSPSATWCVTVHQRRQWCVLEL